MLVRQLIIVVVADSSDKNCVLYADSDQMGSEEASQRVGEQTASLKVPVNAEKADGKR